MTSPVFNNYPTVPDDFLSFSRKKKHPHLAHRSHEFFDASLAPPFPTRTSQRQLDDETDSRVSERESEIGIWCDSAKESSHTYYHYQIREVARETFSFGDFFK